jgi:hypothetical protein
MTRGFIILLFSLLLNASHAQQPKLMSDSHAMEFEIKRCMQALKTCMLGKDSAGMDALLADGLTYGHSNGWIQTKLDLIRSVMSGEQDYKRIEPRSMQIRIHGDAAVVNVESLVALDFRGEFMELDMDILLVWVKMNGNWKLIARQSVKNS